MVRLFSHYVSGRLVLLIVVEALLLMLSAYAGFSFHHWRAAVVMVEGAGAAVPSQATVFALGMLVVMNSMGLYQQDLWKDGCSALVRLVGTVVVGLGIMVLAAHVFSPVNLGGEGLAIMVIVALIGIGLARFLFYRWDKLSAFKPRVLVLGTGSRVMRLTEYAQRNHSHVVVGYLALHSSTHDVALPGVLPMAPGDSLLEVVKKYRIDQIVVAVNDRRNGGLPVQELLECRMKGVNVTELPTFFEREYRQVLLEALNPSWIVLGDGFRQGWLRTAMKRLFDLTASVVLLVLAFPLILVAAACIYLESGGPVFYRQERVGEGGRVFTIYKLRSMKIDAERDGTPRWATTDDDRTTRVGRIIRKLRIDELPQIINVLKGEMAFVGPRPERPFFVDQLVKQIPYYSLRHSSKPGITGWAQVCCSYGASLDDAIEKLQYDLYYVKNHTLFLDLVILIAPWRSCCGVEAQDNDYRIAGP
jgi:sugar transferase (PEP-CTERM system associated)